MKWVIDYFFFKNSNYLIIMKWVIDKVISELHHIISCLMHPTSRMPAFVRVAPSSLPLVVLPVIDVGDCGYICSRCRMTCMRRMVARSSQQHIVVRMTSWCHQSCTLVGMCNCIHLVLLHMWGIDVLLLVCPWGALHSQSLLLPSQQIGPQHVLCPCM